MTGNFVSIKWTWWIKLFSVNSDLVWIKWDLLRVSETSLCWVNIEVQNRTFRGVEKLSECEECKELLIY